MAVLVALAVTVVIPGAAQAVEGDGLSVRLVEAPEARRDDPRARSYIVDHLAPGSSITRRIEVTNDTAAPMRVDLYPGPAGIVGGQWTPADAGATSDLTEWTEVALGRASLAPGASVTVPVTIEVPRDASEGERYGVVWAQTASTGSAQVQMVSRVGIRVYLSVGPGGEPATDFAIEALTGARLPDGTLQVRGDVANTGGRAIDLEGSLRLTAGPSSLSGGPYPAELGSTLAPGGTGQVVVDLRADLPRGPWHAVLTLRSGSVQRTGEADLTFPVSGIGAPVPVEQGLFGGWRPWAGAAAALAALGLLGIHLVRRRRAPQARSGPGVPAP